MSDISNLNPQSVFHFFEEISAVPRASGNRTPISEYCMNFAKERNLACYRDSAYNVMIKKPASKGYENAPTVILQGHLDMVAEKTADSTMDFDRDGITLQVDGDWISAKDTTLGADNGIAVAMALAILDDDTLKHPPLEVLLTTDEEVGMLGAADLDASFLQGKLLLNLDSEEEGVFTAGCAGGIRADCRLPVEKMPCNLPAITITVQGLEGGHSGVEIHRYGGNAMILLGRILYALGDKIRLVSLQGGGKDNVIPREASAVVAVEEQEVSSVLTIVDEMGKTLQNEYKTTDPALMVSAEKSGMATTAQTDESTKKCVAFLTLAPNGVICMDPHFKGLVQTSLNLGVLHCEDEFHAAFATRSSLRTQKEMLVNRLTTLTQTLGGTISFTGNYPAWEYQKDSHLRETACKLYETMFGKTPDVNVVHGGLECGILSEKIPGLDALSYGPDIPDIHTTMEKMSISSVKRVWDFTVKLLEELAK
ncbi:MAG: aminoacyl-histidine dipeptidase [Oscillospiraceae bacterium]|nr:aminoacyl-histidine dipeptidase [Oscillospiraceae bacterium]